MNKESDSHPFHWFDIISFFVFGRLVVVKGRQATAIVIVNGPFQFTNVSLFVTLLLSNTATKRDIPWPYVNQHKHEAT